MRHIRVVIKCLPCSALDIVQNWQFQIVWSQSIEYFMYKYFKYLCNGKLVLPKKEYNITKTIWAFNVWHISEAFENWIEENK